jgi:hypothetical protein
VQWNLLIASFLGKRDDMPPFLPSKPQRFVALPILGIWSSELTAKIQELRGSHIDLSSVPDL